MPAIIRTEQSQVTLRAGNPVATQAPQTGLGALGGALGDLGNAFDQIQDDIDTADAKQADAEYSDLIRRELYEDTTGFMYAQGGDAAARRKDVARRIQDGQKELLNRLSPGAKKHASSAMQARFQRALSTVDQHTAAQRNEYLNSASAARITTATNDAIFDPAVIQQSLATNRQEILDMADRNGWPKEQVDLKLEESATAIHGGIVQRLAVADPVAALEYLRDNKDSMQGATVASLEAKIVPLVRERVGRQKGAQAAATWGRVPDGFDWANHTAQGGSRPDAISGLDDNFEIGLANMINGAPADIKSGLTVFSGYRSVERQEELWADALKKYGSVAEARKWVAPPGNSNHNHGKAADLMWNGKRLDQAPDHVKRWVHENAAQFGLHFPLGNEPWHVEIAGTRGTAAFVPPETGLQDLLSIEDPDERDAAISEYNLIKGIASAQKEAQRQAAADAAFQVIEAGGNINDLALEHRQHIGREEMSALRSYQQKRVAGVSVETDDETYVQLADMMATNPEAFMAANPLAWRDKLSDSDFQFFVKQRADMKSGLRNAATSAPTISTLRTASSTALKAAGIDSKPEVAAAFESDLLRWSTSFTTENGAPPSSLEINDRINQMLVPITINPVGTSPGLSGLIWDFGKQDGRAFEIDYDGSAATPDDDLTPEDVRDGRLSINGTTVSNEMMEIFAQGFQDRLGRAPKVRELIEGLIETGLYE